MAVQRILIIEDNSDIRELVRYSLQREGYDVSGTGSGEEGLQIARSSLPDLVLLDLMLPGMDGLRLCRKLKDDPKTRRIPVVMLTAKGEESDVVVGLEMGADDYITKPFSPKILVARLRAVLRRRADDGSGDDAVLDIDGMTIDPGRFQITVDSKPVAVTLTEFKLLYTLARRRGWVFTRDQLVDHIRGEDVLITDRAVDVHIAGLRKKLGPAAEYIETIRGIGYRFRE
ncbi:MAG: response regulator [candidate division Zixibacteria bacterium]|nr:response regulator [candidate division Zixibacteria bacterium]